MEKEEGEVMDVAGRIERANGQEDEGDFELGSEVGKPTTTVFVFSREGS